jgi:hypothetical protein
MAKAIPTQHSTHSLQALVFASQSPYSGLQTVFYLFALGDIKTTKF